MSSIHLWLLLGLLPVAYFLYQKQKPALKTAGIAQTKQSTATSVATPASYTSGAAIEALSADRRSYIWPMADPVRTPFI
jgi:hypothetical protein